MAKTREKHPLVSRLVTAIRQSRWSLQRFRQERLFAVTQYVGKHWSDEGTSHEVPINLLSMFVQIVGRNLISKNPKVLMQTFDRAAKPAVNAMQSWANTEIERMNYAQRCREIVTDALFSVGIGKVALATPSNAQMANWNLRAGAPFFDSIDLDDLVFDMHARKFDEVGFIGHRYRVHKDIAVADKNFSSARKKLETSNDPPFNEMGDLRINVLQRSWYGMNSEEYDDFVDLWEIYMPEHRKVLTLSLDANGESLSDEPLEEKTFIGPDRALGPYYRLSYMHVPGNAMGKAPIQDLIDLHNMFNNIQRKLNRESRDFKQIIGYRGGQEGDAQKIKDARDGDIIPMTDPAGVANFRWGGPDAQLMGMAETTRSLFSWAAGNLDVMGGLQVQAETAAQEKLLNQNSSRSIVDMQESTLKYTDEVLKGLAWYWWHDPFKVIRTPLQIPGMTDSAIMREVTPADRQQTPWEQVDVRVSQYSLQNQTPPQKLAALDATVDRYLMAMPHFQAQGVMLDWQKYMKKRAEYLDMPDIPEVFTIQEPIQSTGTAGEGAPKPTDTTRNYVRTSQTADKGPLDGMNPRKAMQMAGQNGSAQSIRNGSM